MVANERLPTNLRETQLELHTRLADFLEDYSIQNRPVLVWQCRPCQPVEVDVSARSTQDVIARGAASSVVRAWWHGFRPNYGIVRVFSGISATEPTSDSGYTVELHTDGHLIAGLWSFPERQEESGTRSCLADFHRNAFQDFAELAREVARLSTSGTLFYITATLLNAKSLRVAIANNGWASRLRPMLRTNLQWRIRTCDVSALHTAGEQMSEDYCRACNF